MKNYPLIYIPLFSSVCTLSEEEIGAVREQCVEIKAEGNEAFAAKDYELAVEKYSVSD
jgi:hypothetical protein